MDMDRESWAQRRQPVFQGEGAMDRTPPIAFAITHPSRTGPFENSLEDSPVTGSVSEGDTETLPFFTPGHRAIFPDSTPRQEELAPLLRSEGGGYRAMGDPSHLTMKPGAQVQLPVMLWQSAPF